MKLLALQVGGYASGLLGVAMLAAAVPCWLVYDRCERTADGGGEVPALAIVGGYTSGLLGVGLLAAALPCWYVYDQCERAAARTDDPRGRAPGPGDTTD